MKKIPLAIVLTAFLIGSTATPIQASTKVCDSLGGSVVFKDTLYGTGTGLVLSTLVLMATKCTDCTFSVLSGGALAGGTIGSVLGFVELATRDCDSSTHISSVAKQPEPAKFRWSVTPLFTKADSGGSGALMNATLRF